MQQYTALWEIKRGNTCYNTGLLSEPKFPIANQRKMFDCNNEELCCWKSQCDLHVCHGAMAFCGTVKILLADTRTE